MSKFKNLADQIQGLDMANEHEDMTVSAEWLMQAVDALREADKLEQREAELNARLEMLLNKAMSVCAAPYDAADPRMKTKGDFIYELGKIIDETPYKTLNDIRRKAFIQGFSKGSAWSQSWDLDETVSEGAERHVNERYPDKE